MKHLVLSSDFQNFNYTYNHKEKRLTLQWHGPIHFPPNACVGLKEIALTPLANKWENMSKTECFFVSVNFGSGDLFNPRKKLCAVPVMKHNSYIHHFYDNPGMYSEKFSFMTHD